MSAAEDPKEKEVSLAAFVTILTINYKNYISQSLSRLLLLLPLFHSNHSPPTRRRTTSTIWRILCSTLSPAASARSVNRKYPRGSKSLKLPTKSLVLLPSHPLLNQTANQLHRRSSHRPRLSKRNHTSVSTACCCICVTPFSLTCTIYFCTLDSVESLLIMN